MYWAIPKMWPGATVFILGGGPTLLDSLNGFDLTGKHVLAVNLAFRLPYSKLCFFGDAKFYWWNRNGLDRFTGYKITANDRSNGQYRSVAGQPGVRVVRRKRQPGLENRVDMIRWNRSSGGAAIDVAVHLGAKRIVLLGYDMRVVNGKKNWAPHPKEHTKKNPFARFLEAFEPVRIAAEERGVEILNATPDSALTTFPKVGLSKLM